MTDKKNDEKLKPMHHEGHNPKTRREFLAQGFLGASAMTLAPSLLSLVSGSARAAVEGCPSPLVTGMAGVIIIDLAGGGNIAGSNVMVGGQGGQQDFLPNYQSLGLPPDFHPSMSGTNNEMGLVFHSDSGMLRGIQSVTSAGTRAKIEGTIFCTSTDDDTKNNQTNPIYWLNKAGARGTLNQLAGSQQTESGGNTSSPSESINPGIMPVKISSGQDAMNLVSLGALGTMFANAPAAKAEKVLNAISKMSERKLASLSRRSLPEEVKKIVGCGFSGTVDQINTYTPALLDPSADPLVTQVFPNMAGSENQRKAGSLGKLVLDGFVGVGTISLGGYDYHTGNRSVGEIKDLEAGQVIGRLMELAALKQKDLVIIVFTDGGVSANTTIDNTVDGRGKYAWIGDSGQRSSSVMMVYKKDGRPQMRDQKRQIGYYRPSSASVENTALLTSNSVVNLSKALVANYLALHGQEGSLASVVGSEPFGTNLDKYISFNKLR